MHIHHAPEPLWGIDLGGTKIEGAIMDPDNPANALYRFRVPTEREHGYGHILGQFEKLIGTLERESGLTRPKAIGIGTPGTLDPQSGLIKNSNTVCLNGMPLARDLSQHLGLEITMTNDANCFALAEAALGAAAGRHVVFGVILGTGVGGGVVVNGSVLTGRHGIAGEWGHNVIDPDGAPCYCGRRGCLETICSGPALERFYAAQTGAAKSLREIATSTGTDTAARATIKRLISYLAKALGPLINILDPDAVVLGGGVGNIDALYTDQLREELRKHVFNPEVTTEILKPKLGDSAGVFGAAMLHQHCAND